MTSCSYKGKNCKHIYASGYYFLCHLSLRKFNLDFCKCEEPRVPFYFIWDLGSSSISINQTLLNTQADRLLFTFLPRNKFCNLVLYDKTLMFLPIQINRLLCCYYYLWSARKMKQINTHKLHVDSQFIWIMLLHCE